MMASLRRDLPAAPHPILEWRLLALEAVLAFCRAQMRACPAYSSNTTSMSSLQLVLSHR